jgi:tetratricopeptide (TPR) repeat protein
MVVPDEVSGQYSLVADHFQYLASVGIMVPVASGIALQLKHWQLWRHPTGSVICVALLAPLTILTWRQSAMYSDVETLWRTIIERNPTAWMAHNNLGAFLLRAGKVDEAIVHFRKALEIKADHVEAQANLGNALLQEGELDNAIAEYDKALEIKPDYAEVHYNLGNALLRKGQVDQAIAHYEKALAIKPDYADVHNNLGIVLLQKGQVDQAIALSESNRNKSSGYPSSRQSGVGAGHVATNTDAQSHRSQASPTGKPTNRRRESDGSSYTRSRSRPSREILRSNRDGRAESATGYRPE